MPFPRDFLDEVETELRDARLRLSGDRARVDALEGLYALSLRLALELGRQIGVFDLIDAAADERERERRLALVRELRVTT